MRSVELTPHTFTFKMVTAVFAVTFVKVAFIAAHNHKPRIPIDSCVKVVQND